MASRHAITRIEVVVILVLFFVVVAIVVIGMSRGRGESRKQKDGDQLRYLHQGLVVSCRGGGDDYPIPSRLDRANYVIDAEAATKDTTANMFSFMVFGGTIKPEHLISPCEINKNIVPRVNYEYDHPSGAANPIQAMWDPKLSAALDGSQPGNISYAHMQLFQGRRAKWTASFSASEAVLANRGPEISSLTRAGSAVTPTLANPASNSLRFYGSGRTWSGWAAFNDNHVDFRSDYLKQGREFAANDEMKYTNDVGKQMPDIWCYDELDDSKAANDYIGIFLQAGAKREDWKAAWD